jgi:transglutaminase-like putative cysteine protease
MPFMADLPIWLLLILALVVVWRWQVMRGKMQRPPQLLVVFAIVAGIGTLFLSGLDQYTLDSAVAFCLLGYLLKSLEVLRRRDGIFQIYLGFFLSGVYFLYHSSPISALLVAGLLFVNTLALQAVTSSTDFSWRYALTQTSVLVVGAIPIMILGYLFFPRIPPLWSIPNNERGAMTGMTDEVSPGAIAQLARSQKAAFRVSFEGEEPPRSQWYWRGNTLSEFDGKTWRAKYRSGQLFRNALPAASLPAALDISWPYSVIIEPSRQQWLYFLDWPTQAKVADAVLLPDARYALTSPLLQAIQYSASSSANVQWEPISDASLAQFTRLPARGNEALRDWSLQFRQSRTNDEEFVNDLSSFIRENAFFYTLSPPLYESRDSLEEFWLTGRRGFCSHYASASAYILRAAGIPARLVGGYLGGVYNESADYIQVRQMEAHVWVEFWSEGAWHRFDPTAAVAPNRVEMSLDDLFEGDQSGELPLLSRMRNQMSLFKSATLWWDAVQYQWQINVIDYKSTSAIGWFESRFGRLTPLKAAIAVLSFLGVVSFIIAFSIGLIRLPIKHKEPYRSLLKVERLLGPINNNETVRQYFDRMLKQYPELNSLASIRLLFERSLYNSEFVEVSRLHKAIHNLKVQKLKISGKH